MAQFWLDMDSFADGTNLVQEGIFENTDSKEDDIFKESDALGSYIRFGADNDGPAMFRFLTASESPVVEVYTKLDGFSNFSGGSQCGAGILEENNNTRGELYLGFEELQLRGDYGTETIDPIPSGSPYEIVFRINTETDTVQGKAWPDGDAEPDWMIDITTSGLPSSLFGAAYIRGRTNNFRAFSVGTNGDAAPREQVQTVETFSGSTTAPYTALWTPENRHVGIVRITPQFTADDGRMFVGEPIDFEVGLSAQFVSDPVWTPTESTTQAANTAVSVEAAVEGYHESLTTTLERQLEGETEFTQVDSATGSPVTLNSDVGDVVGTTTFRLTVTDANGNRGTDSQRIVTYTVE